MILFIFFFFFVIFYQCVKRLHVRLQTVKSEWVCKRNRVRSSTKFNFFSILTMALFNVSNSWFTQVTSSPSNVMIAETSSILFSAVCFLFLCFFLNNIMLLQRSKRFSFLLSQKKKIGQDRQNSRSTLINLGKIWFGIAILKI